MANETECVLSDLVNKILSKSISKKELKWRICNELESKNIWEDDNLMITDCYYALKHLDEEPVVLRELLYFQECFAQKRQYSMQDKVQFLLDN